jgi:hypothetical protein
VKNWGLRRVSMHNRRLRRGRVKSRRHRSLGLWRGIAGRLRRHGGGGHDSGRVKGAGLRRRGDRWLALVRLEMKPRRLGGDRLLLNLLRSRRHVRLLRRGELGRGRPGNGPAGAAIVADIIDRRNW